MGNVLVYERIFEPGGEEFAFANTSLKKKFGNVEDRKQEKSGIRN